MFKFKLRGVLAVLATWFIIAFMIFAPAKLVISAIFAVGAIFGSALIYAIATE